jgi:hypothetical protein
VVLLSGANAGAGCFYVSVGEIKQNDAAIGQRRFVYSEMVTILVN